MKPFFDWIAALSAFIIVFGSALAMGAVAGNVVGERVFQNPEPLIETGVGALVGGVSGVIVGGFVGLLVFKRFSK